MYEHAPDSTPRDFALDPNYPNPFNSSITIGYRLDKAGKVRLQSQDAVEVHKMLLLK